MVKKLHIAVSVTGGGLYTLKEIDQIASNLLKQLEDAGMIPPCNDPEAYDEGRVGSIVEHFCTWDPE